MLAVIGSKGYIGSFLMKHFPTAVGDPPPEDVINFSVVIYLGGYSSRKKCGSWAETFDKNVQHVLDVARGLQSHQLLLYASSGAIAAETGELDYYSRSMLERENQLRNLTNVKTVGLRLGGVVGLAPVMRMDLAYHAMFQSAVKNNVISVYNPHTRRSMLCIQDLACCIDTIINNCSKIQQNEVFHLRSFNVSVLEMAQDVARATGNARLEIVSGEEIPGFQLDPSHFLALFRDCFPGFRGTRESVLLSLRHFVQT